jgi:hypothetical protein
MSSNPVRRRRRRRPQLFLLRLFLRLLRLL